MHLSPTPRSRLAKHLTGQVRTFFGYQAGIITNDRHNNAQVIEVRPFRVQDERVKGRVVIIGGFQGVSYKWDITTLGRGGSDTSAVALAAALDAERCEIYSDVDGVYSADPAVVSHARHLKEISYPEMQEMSSNVVSVFATRAGSQADYGMALMDLSGESGVSRLKGGGKKQVDY